MSSSNLAQIKSISVRLLEDYSNKPHQSAIAFAIEFSKTHQKREGQYDYLGSETEDDYGSVMNLTKVKIVSNDFLQALPECPPIHWPSQMLNDPKALFLSMLPYFQTVEGKKESINSPNHECKTKNMTPMQFF
jgi:hypothetical protein